MISVQCACMLIAAVGDNITEAENRCLARLAAYQSGHVVLVRETTYYDKPGQPLKRGEYELFFSGDSRRQRSVEYMRESGTSNQAQQMTLHQVIHDGAKITFSLPSDSESSVLPHVATIMPQDRGGERILNPVVLGMDIAPLSTLYRSSLKSVVGAPRLRLVSEKEIDSEVRHGLSLSMRRGGVTPP